MLPQPESAFFVIADISGYTRFLEAVELDHAQDIIADLMDTIVRRLRPPFRLAKFEGDAAFVYAVSDKADGSALQDNIEGAYFAFRKRLRDIRLATTCVCSACKMMQNLDLKFVCHHGEFIKHKMGGREELVGRDVIVVHRFLKNTAGERVGGHAYALYSDAFMRAAGVDAAAVGLIAHTETIDIIGEVPCWLRDLEQAWAEENDRARSEVTRDQAMTVLEFEIAAPRATVWDYFVLPENRPKWRALDEVIETKRGARRGVGTVNHCMHGGHAVVEEVLDWRPHDYLTFTTLVPAPGAPKVLMTYAFFDTGARGTRVEIRIEKPKPKDQAFFDKVIPDFSRRITGEAAKLKAMLEADETGLSEEPSLTAPANRFLTQPVHAG